MATIFIPVSRLATSREPRLGVSPPWNRSQFSSTRSAPALYASIASSALPQHTSKSTFAMPSTPSFWGYYIFFQPFCQQSLANRGKRR